MRFNILNGTPPYNYVITTNNNCIEIQNPTGTASYDGEWYVETDVWGTDDCIVNSNTVLTITDSNGCISQHDVVVEDYCNGYSLEIIASNNTFTAIPIGFNPDNFIWQADTNNLIGNSTTNVITYQILNPVPTQINVTAIDGNCILTASYLWRPEQIEAFPVIADTSCGNFTFCPNANKGIYNLPLNVQSSTLQSGIIDWSTLQIAGFPSSACIVNNMNGTINFAINDSILTSLQLSYNVKSVQGVLSNTSSIILSLPKCLSSGIFANDNIVHNSTTTVDVINLEDKVTGTPNWTTLEFVALSGQTVTSNVLTTASGTAIFTGTSIKHTQTTLTSKVEEIRWRVKDVNGNYSNSASLYLDKYAYSPIAAVNDSQCGSCGSLITIPIYANDTGNILSTQITYYDSGVIPSITTSGIKVAISDSVNTNKTVKYKLLSTDYVWSNEATVTIIPSCAGRDITNSICSSTISLPALLVNSTTGGTWSQLTGPTVSLTTPSAVVFTTSGTYTFKYITNVSGCIDESIVTIFVNTASTNDNCTQATFTNYTNSPITINSEIKNCDTTDTTIATVIDPNMPTGWNTVANKDVWFVIRPSTATSFVIEADASMYVNGLSQPQIAVYRGGTAGSSCSALGAGGLSEVSTSSSTTKKVSVSVIGPTPGTDYHVRISTRNNSKGKFKFKII